MPEVLRLDHLSLRAGSASVSLSLQSGVWLSVLGRSGSGKSRFVSVLAGDEKPQSGAVIRALQSRRPVQSLGRRATPQSLALDVPGATTSSATEAMSHGGIWDLRGLPIATLPTSRQIMARLAAACAGSPAILTLDEELDALDPWDREHATSLLNWFLHRGGSLIVATHLAEVGVLGQEAVVLVDEEIAFAGSMDRLLSGADTVLEVETEDGGALKALIAPFQVKVEKLNPRQFRLTAQEGQELAVKMILEGYGTIRLVETRPPTLLEALTALESRLGRRQTR